MEQFIGCDAHKKYSVFVAVNERGEASPAIRVVHDREQYRQFLEGLPAGSQIALEAGGHYYWMVDEMEAAGHQPRLVHPLEAKKRMGKTSKKTDQVDAHGLGILLRNGTLPEVWIPPSGLRDQRESLRLRMFLVQQRTRLKNRIQGALARYNIQIAGVSDLFGGEGRLRLGQRLGELPEHTRQSVELELVTLDFLEVQLGDIEKRLEELMKVTAEADLLKTLPYVGRILSMVMTLEIGKVERFANLQRHHHAQNPTHIRQRLQQIGFCRYFHQLLESLLDVPQLHFQEIQRHQFQFHTLPGVFRQLSQALAQAQPALPTKQVAHPGYLNVVTCKGSLNPILQPRSLLHQEHAQPQRLPLVA